jgi:hypothetical protein
MDDFVMGVDFNHEFLRQFFFFLDGHTTGARRKKNQQRRQPAPDKIESLHSLKALLDAPTTHITMTYSVGLFKYQFL